MIAVAGGFARGLAAAMNDGDVEGCLGFHTADGAIYSPYGPPAMGREALRATYRDWLGAGERKKRFRVRAAGGCEALGWCLLDYSSDFPDGAGTLVTERGQSLNVMELGSDGVWRAKVSSLTSATPAKRQGGTT
jgi:ketosteroid isomerase-like protein